MSNFPSHFPLTFICHTSNFELQNGHVAKRPDALILKREMLSLMKYFTLYSASPILSSILITTIEYLTGVESISYPESSGSLVSGLVARRDSGEMEFFPQKSGVPVVVRMLSFIKTEVNVSREVGMLDESLDGNQKS